MWVEIIEIRAVGDNRKLLESQLKDFIKEVNTDVNLQNVKVYRHVTLETDLSIHFFHDSQKADTKCSPICTQLVSSLKDFGLVNHTIWVEQYEGEDRNETKK